MSTETKNRKFLDLEGLQYFWNDIKSRLSAINSYLDFLKSVESELTSVYGISPNKRLHVANINTDADLRLSRLPDAGRDIHIIIKNTSSDSIDINIPGDSYYVRICDPVYTIKPSEYLEVNIISDGGSAYIRVAEQN